MFRARFASAAVLCTLLLAPAAAQATPADTANVSMEVTVPRADPAIGEMSATSAIARS